MKKYLSLIFINILILTSFGFFYIANAQVFPSGPVDENNETFGDPYTGTPYGGGGSTNPTNPSQPTGTFCSSQIKTLTDLINFFVCILLRSIVPLLFAGALVVFIYGVVKYILHADEEKEREEGRKFMMYGIIALFVMVSIWGLVQVLRNTFGLDTFIPQLQT